MSKKSVSMKAFRRIGAIALAILAGACSTWQEEQINEAVVEIFVPRDSLQTNIATQLFYWYHVSGATKYELQIATPTFDKIDRLVLDTNVTGNQYELTLSPGSYEWRVRAFNGSSATDFTVSRLYIDSTLDLTNQTVVLLNPLDRDTSNRGSYSFKWQKLYNADSYQFELFQPDRFGQLIHSKEVISDNLNFSPETQGSFEWRVKAMNSTSQTVFFEREFYRDATPPLAPSLQSPANNAMLSGATINFTWQSDRTGSSIKDTLFLSTDSSFGGVPYAKYYSPNEEAVADTLSTGVYYWRVRSYDKAGNIGAWSTSRKFTAQ